MFRQARSDSFRDCLQLSLNKPYNLNHQDESLYSITTESEPIKWINKK